MKKKKFIAFGASLVLVLAAGMTASAGHHGTCAGRVIQNSGLCQYRGSHDGGHHLFWHDGGQDCAYWGIDVRGICDNWEYCHGGAGTVYGQQGADAAAEGQPAGMASGVQPTTDATGSQATAIAAPGSQPTADPQTGSQAEPQTGYGAGPAGAETYGGGGYTYCTGYGYGGHHGEWNDCPGSCATGCYGSGHHGRGHH